MTVSGKKLSAITASPVTPALTDSVVGVSASGSDYRYTVQQIKSATTLVFNVKDYGALGNGNSSGVGTDDITAIQAAENAASTAGGGIVFFPAGTYVISTFIVKRDKVQWIGVPGATTIIAKLGVDTWLVQHPDFVTPFVEMRISGIIFDGNQANAPRQTASDAFEVWPVLSGHVSDCVFQNASAYGYASQGHTVPLCSKNLLLDHCVFTGNGIGAANTPDTFDGFDMKYGQNVTLLHCIASNNADTGINPRGTNIALINCEASGNSMRGIALEVFAGLSSSISVIGGSSHGNAIYGIRLPAGGAGDPKSKFTITGVDVYSNPTGVYITDDGTGPVDDYLIEGGNIRDNTGHGVVIDGSKKSVEIVGTRCEDNGGSGIKVSSAADNVRLVGVISTRNTEYGLREDSTTTNVNAIGCDFSGNTAGSTLTSPGNTGPSANVGSGSVLIASSTATAATTLDLVLSPYSSKYRAIEIILTGLKPSVDGAVLWLQTSSDGGATFDGGASDYAWAWQQVYPDATTIYTGHDASDTVIVTGLQIGNAANESAYAELTFMSLTAAALYHYVQISGVALDTLSLPTRVTASGARNQAAIVNAVRFLMSSGTLTTNWAIYGVL